jgi:hypothetical protein
VKYEFPRFFGITNTLSPVFRVPDVVAPADEDAAAEVAAEDEGVELGDDDEQAASTGDMNTGRRASHVARLSLIDLILSIVGQDLSGEPSVAWSASGVSAAATAGPCSVGTR